MNAMHRVESHCTALQKPEGDFFPRIVHYRHNWKDHMIFVSVYIYTHVPFWRGSCVCMGKMDPVTFLLILKISVTQIWCGAGCHYISSVSHLVASLTGVTYIVCTSTVMHSNSHGRRAC